MNVGDPPERVLSLFAGIGGLDLGVHRALRSLGRIPEPVCYVEGEAFAVGTLAAQIAAGRMAAAPVWSDVRTFGADVCPGPIDGIIGGFPCQDISSAGKRAGIAGERSGLFFEIARLVRELGPRWVFLENVRAITSRGIDTVLGTLADLGLDAEWTCLRASDVGAPHRRDRWFCLAYRLGFVEGHRVDCISAPTRRRRSGPPVEGERLALSDAKRSGLRIPEQRKQFKPTEFRDPGSRELEHDGDTWPLPWPPGPGDLDGWREVLAIDPDIEPAVCRVAHGLPSRVDRLRALGNAVVPAQAEAAFVHLWTRAYGGAR